MSLGVGREARVPFRFQLGAALAGGDLPMVADFVRDVKRFRIIPIVERLGPADFVFTERFAVGLGGAGAGRRAPADDAAYDDQTGSRLFRDGFVDRALRVASSSMSSTVRTDQP
jgi:hypothetical protein